MKKAVMEWGAGAKKGVGRGTGSMAPLLKFPKLWHKMRYFGEKCLNIFTKLTHFMPQFWKFEGAWLQCPTPGYATAVTADNLTVTDTCN